MPELPFRAQASQTAGSGSSGDNSFIGRGGEDAEINGQQGEAPGGRWPQDDLPVASTPSGGQGWTEGFNPTSENPPLPGTNTEGVGSPPSGNRR
jgi:hypothetical protein